MGLSQGASMYFSSFSIVLIAVDRFMFICKPHWKPISTQMVRKLQFSNTIIVLIILAGLHLLINLDSRGLPVGLPAVLLHEAQSP